MGRGLVGRDRELAALEARLPGGAGGGGGVVLVSGEAGIGKSRLVAALVERVGHTGGQVLLGRTTEQAGAPPYWPWLQVLAPLGAAPLLEAPLLGAPIVADPQSERFRRFESVAAALVQSEAALVVLEDVHRADAASLHLLGHVAERVVGPVTGAALLIVVTHRPNLADQVPELGPALEALARLPGTQRLDLAGLDGAAVARLLGEEAGADVVDAVVATSGGNPLYVGELARHLAAGNDLATVPRSVRESVRVRLAERSPTCVDVVRVGAVIGRTFEVGLVATVTGRAAHACLADLDEAVAAGLVERGANPGEFRFVHALVRDAVEATSSAAEVAAHHQQVADGIECYAGTGDAQAAALARHRDAASALGDRASAAHWCERAAVVADQHLAWEEAVRLFERALELGQTSAEPLDRYRRALGAARARLACDDIAVAVARCVDAARAARQVDRPDLVADATLVPEGRAVDSAELRDLALEALGGLPPDDHARRARLHGQLTNIGYYLDPPSMLHHCEAAEAAAASSEDPFAELAAIRARHMVSHAPRLAAARLELAARFGRAARMVRRPSIALWEPLWRTDALVELGRVAEAVAGLPALRLAVDAAAAPIARWHLARVEAALAQATARFADGLAHAAEARRLFAQLEGPYGAMAMELGYRVPVALHIGWGEDLIAGWEALDLATAPPFLGELPLLGLIAARTGAGDLDGARAAYDRLSPAAGPAPPPPLWLHLHASRIEQAAALGAVDDLAPLLDALSEHRGMHVGTGGGVVTYLGAVELWLGIAAAALGRLDDADRDLAAAAESARRSGTPGFAVHAEVERASVLAARGARDDVAQARLLLEGARPAAQRLGMRPWLSRIDVALAGLAPDAGPLSTRELEVAGLVAEGRTNRQIAEALYLSERTAQNHVQHILTKLGLANRTQVAAWYQARTGSARGGGLRP